MALFFVATAILLFETIWKQIRSGLHLVPLLLSWLREVIGDLIIIILSMYISLQHLSFWYGSKLAGFEKSRQKNLIYPAKSIPVFLLLFLFIINKINEKAHLATFSSNYGYIGSVHQQKLPSHLEYQLIFNYTKKPNGRK